MAEPAGAAASGGKEPWRRHDVGSLEVYQISELWTEFYPTTVHNVLKLY